MNQPVGLKIGSLVNILHGGVLPVGLSHLKFLISELLKYERYDYLIYAFVVLNRIKTSFQS